MVSALSSSPPFSTIGLAEEVRGSGVREVNMPTKQRARVATLSVGETEQWASLSFHSVALMLIVTCILTA